MKLFISHASEDQPDFVRPLAEALKKEYDVWYSEYELTIGDSLLQKIDSGLASCDFGIVVLSKPFFEKKWPRAELDGLFARETQFRKIILPIWKDITEEEVKAYSPILSGRLAVSTTVGLPKVLEEIRMAVSVADRQRTLNTIETATQRVQKVRQNVLERRRAHQLLMSEEGAALISAGVDAIWQTIQNVLSVGADEAALVKFAFSKNSFGHMLVRTVHGMYLEVRAKSLEPGLAMNGALETNIFKRGFDQFNRPVGNDIDFYSTEFKPNFVGADELVWIDSETSATRRSEELGAYLVERFLQHIDEIM